MLKIFKSPFCFTVFLFMAFSFQCKKNSEKLNVILYNKTSSQISSYIKGTWKLEFERGGICGNCTNYIDKFFWQFSLNNKIIQTHNDTIITDTFIKWNFDKPANNDSTYIMNFSDKRGYPYFYVAYGIINDTLILTDAGYDPISYYFTKKN